jgi:putative ABC transport system permease protein
VALAFVLVAGAGLMIRSFLLLQRVDPGFDPSGVLTARIELPAQYDDDAKIAAYFERLRDEIAAIAGVRAVGAANRIALEGYSWTGDLSVEGRPEVWGRELRHKRVVRGYAKALGLRLVEGRELDEFDREGTPGVVVVNETFAREYFPGESAVGRRVSFTRPHERPQWVTVVGVVGDEKQDGLDARVRPEVHESHLQTPDSDMTIVVRTATDPASYVPSLRQAVARLDPTVAPFDIRTMDERMAEAVTQQRLSVWIFGCFGVAALAIAALGVGGVVALAVTSRRREVAVRVALGATRGEVLRLVIGDGLRLALAGLALGLGLAVLLGRWLTSLLYQTAPADPVVLAVVAATLLAAALVAGYLPARAALRLDPIRVLRTE